MPELRSGAKPWNSKGRLAPAADLNGETGLIDYGNVCPELAFTCATSAALIAPLALTSVRKLAAVTGKPDCPLVCAMSAEFTDLFALVSPMSMFTLIAVSGRT